MNCLPFMPVIIAVCNNLFIVTKMYDDTSGINILNLWESISVKIQN